MLSPPSTQELHGIPRGSRCEFHERVVWTQSRVVQNGNTTKGRSVLKSWNGSEEKKKKKKNKGKQQQKKKNQVKTLKQNVTYTLHYIRHATWISFGFTPDRNVASGNWCLCLIRTFVILLTIFVFGFPHSTTTQKTFWWRYDASLLRKIQSKRWI